MVSINLVLLTFSNDISNIQLLASHLSNGFEITDPFHQVDQCTNIHLMTTKTECKSIQVFQETKNGCGKITVSYWLVNVRRHQEQTDLWERLKLIEVFETANILLIYQDEGTVLTSFNGIMSESEDANTVGAYKLIVNHKCPNKSDELLSFMKENRIASYIEIDLDTKANIQLLEQHVKYIINPSIVQKQNDRLLSLKIRNPLFEKLPKYARSKNPTPVPNIRNLGSTKPQIKSQVRGKTPTSALKQTDIFTSKVITLKKIAPKHIAILPKVLQAPKVIEFSCTVDDLLSKQYHEVKEPNCAPFKTDQILEELVIHRQVPSNQQQEEQVLHFGDKQEDPQLSLITFNQSIIEAAAINLPDYTFQLEKESSYEILKQTELQNQRRLLQRIKQLRVEMSYPLKRGDCVNCDIF
ncbi:hypothetical protein FGO68_gene4232 [Halteria grandinella]|uniref:Uncharacterized protein n=1 Tax=Halteria grandinella TaxID=5974 RepID=A0A8J8T1B9_HALGN|nr:hypothetical protein FGO68_gene4232 [Halteria grandinella]